MSYKKLKCGKLNFTKVKKVCSLKNTDTIKSKSQSGKEYVIFV